ncbi:MAG: L-lactate permease [Rhodospirillales bacterium]|nr:L-lactate permease [Rhodospirillales bacterium]
MHLLLDALPLATLVLLLASGRVTPPFACLAAILLTLPAAWALAPGQALLPFLLRAVGEGLWLAVVPVGIISGGLVYYAAVGARDAPEGATTETLFVAAFLLGPFMETVTGFGVGCVFALGLIRAAGLRGPRAAAIGLLTQALIPWGGLGPGTALGAALAAVPPQAMAARNAGIVAATLPFLLMLFWRWTAAEGHPVPARDKPRQMLWVLALGASLIVWHRVAPWEMCGLLATGGVLAAKLLWRAPPRTPAAALAKLRAALPYLLLAAALLASHLWRDAPSLGLVAGLPPIAANSAMVVLWLVALALLARAAAPVSALRSALARARRPALALLGFVLFSRVLADAGVPRELAGALTGALGPGAPFAAPLLAGIAGFFAGTNVGANAAMMPLQAALGRAAHLGPLVLPAAQNGSLFLLLSPQLTAIACAVLADGTRPSGIWRVAWPIFPLALVIGLAAVALGVVAPL